MATGVQEVSHVTANNSNKMNEPQTLSLAGLGQEVISSRKDRGSPQSQTHP